MMTTQEAIKILWQYDVNFEPYPAEEVMHAIDLAIEALELVTIPDTKKDLKLQKSNDTINRADAIDATWKTPSYTDPMNVLTEVRDRLEALPSAQPEQRWIPVSERLPEDSEYHLVTEYHMVSFARYWEHRWWDAFGDKAKFVTAWMPLPEPYGGKEK